MKTLHIVYSFAPDPGGGTEVYVESLCRELPALGVETVVVAPGAQDQSYSLGGLRVRRFVANPSAVSLEDMYGRGDAAAADAFERILVERGPVHQHSFSPACSVISCCAHRRGVPVVSRFTDPAERVRDSLLPSRRALRQVSQYALRAWRCTATAFEGGRASRGADSAGGRPRGRALLAVRAIGNGARDVQPRRPAPARDRGAVR